VTGKVVGVADLSEQTSRIEPSFLKSSAIALRNWLVKETIILCGLDSVLIRTVSVANLNPLFYG